MGLETLVVGGETLTFFNIAEEMSFLRDVFFSFLGNYAFGLLMIIGIIWVGVFILAMYICIKKQMVESIG